MSRVYGLSAKKETKVAVIPVATETAKAGSTTFLNKSLIKFSAFWDLMDAIEIHGYIRAAMSVIGRSAIGGGWSLVPTDEFSKGTERQRKRLMQFYANPIRTWDNVKDFQTFTYKLIICAMYLKYFGQAAFHIVRNSENIPIGLDFLPGFIFPNVDEQGFFKSPAFIQYPMRSTSIRAEFEKADDIIYIINPDWEGYPTGGSDIESITDFALPLDLYLQLAAREYMKNRDKPEAFYVLPSDVSDDAFNAFAAALEARYAGPRNIGRSPITVAGELEIKELSKFSADLPYQAARVDTRQEVLAVSGVTGAKLGITDSLSSANLREARREFHETTMVPLFRLIETAIYEQLHVREFGMLGWLFKFNNPDFLTAVERATVHMRYYSMNALSPNEIRRENGKPDRKDKFGDMYADQLKSEQDKAKKEQQPSKNPAAGQPGMMDNPQGSPPEGHDPNAPAPADTGEPTLDNQDPPRGDQHDETTQRTLADLRQWRSFLLNRIKKGRGLRPFETQDVPVYLRDAIQERIDGCDTAAEIKAVFAEVTLLLEEA